MKHNTICFFTILLLTAFAGFAAADDYVDIGDPVSEAAGGYHAMSSWGPIVPGTIGGNYGGIDHCRAIWSNGPGDNSITASIVMDFSGDNQMLSFKHLEGIADDGFEVYIDSGTLPVYTHTELTTTETWFVSGFWITLDAGYHTITFEATGTAWGSWQQYGQVCFAEIWVNGGNPVPNETITWSQVKSLF